MNKLMSRFYSNKKAWLLIAGLVFAVQLAVPAFMIFEQQQTLKHGNLHKFKIRPIDPYDPFRGRYVILAFDAESEPVPASQSDKEQDIQLKRNDWAYAKLEIDSEGFSKFSSLALNEPTDNDDYLRVKTRFIAVDKTYRIDISFDRYYAPEGKALAIENSVRRGGRQTQDDVYVAVKVRNGKGTIEDLYINGMPILDFVKKQQ